MSKQIPGQKIIIFTCNWHAYSSLERAGIERLSIAPVIFPIRLACLGRITSGIILKAFENGAEGIMLLGCPEGECKHHSGNKSAWDVFQEAKSLLNLMGFNDNKLRYVLIEANDGKSFVEELKLMVSGVDHVKG
jgi:coenzyme F420-reducing hydrogenase delta subunit